MIEQHLRPVEGLPMDTSDSLLTNPKKIIDDLRRELAEARAYQPRKGPRRSGTESSHDLYGAFPVK